MPQQFAFFAGGITSGKTIGTTNPDGSDTVDSVWSQQRYLYPEDIEAITYSAIGTDRTTVRHDALGCGFAYRPTTDAPVLPDQRVPGVVSLEENSGYRTVTIPGYTPARRAASELSSEIKIPKRASA